MKCYEIFYFLLFFIMYFVICLLFAAILYHFVSKTFQAFNMYLQLIYIIEKRDRSCQYCYARLTTLFTFHISLSNVGAASSKHIRLDSLNFSSCKFDHISTI